MRKQLIAAAVMGILSLPTAALAESTTGTTLTVDGTPRVGSQVTMHVTLTGSHIVFLGRGTVSGGTVDLYVDGNVIAHVQIDGHNSNVTKVDPCVVVVGGVCVADRYYSDHTEFGYPVTLSNTPGQHVFGARFTGDTNSHSSSSPNVTITAIPIDVSAAIDLLLND
ncbi:hypothetical protein ACQKIE_01225 [Luteibacter sp. NPDC031894]|uniref:hypothetical protein n=1 Tax=Luteibacter sp. NPDC031894 TaxID=3390572 RepID=UPI003D0644C8